nr:hypothetical protein [Actinomycetales bacterium]
MMLRLSRAIAAHGAGRRPSCAGCVGRTPARGHGAEAHPDPVQAGRNLPTSFVIRIRTGVTSAKRASGTVGCVAVGGGDAHAPAVTGLAPGSAGGARPGGPGLRADGRRHPADDRAGTPGGARGRRLHGLLAGARRAVGAG